MAVDNCNCVLSAKFRGSLVGALMGDCFGATFEFEYPIERNRLNDYFVNLMKEESSEILRYTDDAYMTMAVASSLVEKGEMDARDMAKKFVDDYYKQPRRGYGTKVTRVFRALRDSNFEDIFLPAKLQFDGTGSFGNGAAMRIAPIALFGNRNDYEFIVNAALECSHITHTHQNGYIGAILQCLAVSAALKLDSSQILEPVHFIDNLLEKMEDIEPKPSVNPEPEVSFFWKLYQLVFDNNTKKGTERPYCESLKKMKKLYLQNRDESISIEEVVKTLGHGYDVSALQSVPTAIFSFLRGMKPLKDFETSNPFLRTLYFAISVGGDTDTIACMAGSIAGAYYGVDMIPEVLQKKCESIDEIIKLADKLFEVTQKE